MSGLQAMVAGMETAATVMDIPIVFIPYLSAVPLKMEIFLGTQKHVHPHLPLHIAVGPVQRSRL